MTEAKEDIIQALKVGININVDRENWVYYILSGQKDIETRPKSVAGQWRKHTGEYIGIVRTTAKTAEIPTGLLVGYARLKAVKIYGTKEEFEKDLHRHLYKSVKDWNEHPRCGLVLEEVARVRPARRLKGAGMSSVRKIEFM